MYVRKFEETKEVMRRCKSKKDRQHNGQDTKEVMGRCKSKKDRQHNGQRNKAKCPTNNDLQNITQKTKD